MCVVAILAWVVLRLGGTVRAGATSWEDHLRNTWIWLHATRSAQNEP